MQQLSPFALPFPGLRDADTRPRGVERVTVQAADGTHLATDVHRPVRAGRCPTVLMRTPYGRNGLTGVPVVIQARTLASRGYAVVVQDVRGRFDSGGDFVPMVNEVADAAATIDWIIDQPWSDCSVGAYGVSYMGGTAWAAAHASPEHVKALAVAATFSAVGLPDPRGVLHLDTTLRWLRSLHAMVRTDESAAARLKALLDARSADDGLRDLLVQLPVIDLDERVLGSPSPIWQIWAAHPDLHDRFWRDGDLRETVEEAPPTAHLSGWYDLFVDRQMTDVHRQIAVGNARRIVVGPWGHLHPAIQTRSFTEMLRHFDHHLLGHEPPGDGVEVHLGGVDEWLTAPTWPATTPVEMTVGPTGDLRGTGTHIVYDPDDPTPSSGGRTLSLDAGTQDVSGFGSRNDVLTFTSGPISRPMTVLGRAELHADISMDTGRGDLWVRLADVDLHGTATAISDGYVRIIHDGTSDREHIHLHPVGHTFRPGHRLRLHLAGGAFPHHDRNLGFADHVRSTRTRPSTMAVSQAVVALPVLSR